MIEQTNIPIIYKNTKKIRYLLSLDDGFWHNFEYDTRGNIIYYENSSGHWVKTEYDDENNEIYYENKFGIIRDDR
jgi:hypothetical protein